MPAAWATWFAGIQVPAPDMALVPPMRSVFSRMMTLSPAALVTRAATSAAAPEPTTTKS